MNIQKILVTPEMAQSILSTNKHNRKIRETAILKFSREMINGNWKEDTGELIKISDSGVLLDGQHRLQAVVKANKAIYFHIANGLNESILPYLDTGNIRTAGDVFKFNGIHYSTNIPSYIQQYYMIKNTSGFVVGNKAARLSNSECFKYYNDYPEFWDMVAVNTSKFYEMFSKALKQSIIGGLYAIFYEIDKEKANSFFLELCSGNNITNKSILILRKKILDDKISASKRIILSTKIVYIIKTWNYYRTGLEVSVLKHNSETENLIKPI